nr:hypothetical protein [Tanacetum cinerariifolium]
MASNRRTVSILATGAKTSSKSMPCCYVTWEFTSDDRVDGVCCDGTFAYAMQAKTLRFSKFGFLRLIASYRVMSSSAFVGTLFKMYMACLTASAQKFCGMFVAFIIHLVVDMIVLFLLSTTPFCCGDETSCSSSSNISISKVGSKSSSTRLDCSFVFILKGQSGLILSVLITGVLTDLIKDATRRPRPDFFWRCFPDGVDNYDHWGNVICTGKDSLIRDGHKSFPSGHTSLSFAGLIFWHCTWLENLKCLISGPCGKTVTVTTFCYLEFFPAPYHTEGWGPYAYFRALEEARSTRRVDHPVDEV